MRHAVIDDRNGQVVNVIEAPENWDGVGSGFTLVASETAGPGDTWDGSVFVRPTLAPISVPDLTQSVTDASSITFSPLDGDRDRIYKLVIMGYLTTPSGDRNVRLGPNGIFGTGAFRHTSRRVGSNGNADINDISRRNLGGFTLGYTNWNDSGDIYIEARLIAYSGRTRQLTGEHVFSRQGQGREVRGEHVSWWNNVDTNITSLVVDFNGGTFTGYAALEVVCAMWPVPVPWNPEDVSLFLELDAADTNVTATAMTDKTGRVFNRTAGTATKNLSGLNGLPTITFSNATFQITEALPWLAQQENFYIFVVMKQPVSANTTFFSQNPGGERVLWHPDGWGNTSYFDVVTAQATGRLSRGAAPFGNNQWHCQPQGMRTTNNNYCYHSFN